MKRILLVATTPLCMDGLTKVEMDIISYNLGIIEFDFACCYGFDNSFGDKLKEWGVKCYNIPPRKNFFSHMYQLQKLVRVGNYDGVYIHGNSSMMIMEALPARFGHARKIITHCHNDGAGFSLLRTVIKPLFNMLVDIKIACSSYAAKWAYDKKNVVIVLNGIDLKEYKYDANVRKRMRAELACDDDTLLIGHVGRFTEQKNHKKIVEIFSEIHKFKPQVKLILIGEGELEDTVKEQVSLLNLTDSVIFAGKTDRVSDYYQAMDLLLMPSYYEGLCIVAIEAQANGLPVVMSDKLSPETYATNSAYVIDLKESAEDWAYEILNNVSVHRYEGNIEQLYHEGFDITQMMRRIQNILLNIRR